MSRRSAWRPLQRGRTGATTMIGKLEFTFRDRRWVHAFDLVGSYDEFRLQNATVRGDELVIFEMVTLNEKSSIPWRVHYQTLLHATERDVERVVRDAMRTLKRISTRRGESPLLAFAEALAATERLPIQYAVREGAEPGWLQREWDSCTDTRAMSALLLVVPVRSIGIWGELVNRETFPNGLCDEYLAWRGGPRIRLRNHDPRGAAKIRSKVPTLPTLAELIARSAT